MDFLFGASLQVMLQLRQSMDTAVMLPENGVFFPNIRIQLTQLVQNLGNMEVQVGRSTCNKESGARLNYSFLKQRSILLNSWNESFVAEFFLENNFLNRNSF